MAYRWASVCTLDPTVPGADLECPRALTCADPAERRWQLWGQLPNGSWVTLQDDCFGGTPPPYVPPTVTPGDVLQALRRVGLPELTTHTQPTDTTLVNLDTIYYTQPRRLDLTLTILGQAVDVTADPTTYTWHHGDGTTQTTTTPGTPYPQPTITHAYTHAHITVETRLETTYQARFRVGQGTWQTIDDPLVTTGPTHPLTIAEATPLLSGDR